MFPGGDVFSEDYTTSAGSQGSSLGQGPRALPPPPTVAGRCEWGAFHLHMGPLCSECRLTTPSSLAS